MCTVFHSQKTQKISFTCNLKNIKASRFIQVQVTFAYNLSLQTISLDFPSSLNCMYNVHEVHLDKVMVLPLTTGKKFMVLL